MDCITKYTSVKKSEACRMALSDFLTFHNVQPGNPSAFVESVTKRAFADRRFGWSKPKSDDMSYGIDWTEVAEGRLLEQKALLEAQISRLREQREEFEAQVRAQVVRGDEDMFSE